MNKFKIGDKVRLVKVDDESFDEYKYYLGKIFKIREIAHLGSSHAYAILEGTKIIPYLKNLELVNNYTYEDLKKCPIGTKITFESGETLLKTAENRFENETSVTETRFINSHLEDKLCGKIIKIEEPEYKTVYEHKEEILDEAEKDFKEPKQCPNLINKGEQIKWNI